MKLSASILNSDQNSAAAAVRKAASEYRQALLSGDLTAALRAKEAQMVAEVQLDRARWFIEGDVL